MRPAIYCRVSSKGQADEGWSLEAQERLCRQYCAERGWGEPDVFIDAGRSAFSESIRGRPAFARLLGEVDAGRFDVVVCHRLDRFARNQETAFREFRRLKEAGATFVSVADRDYDFTTPLGKLLFGLLTGLAEYFSSNLSAETKKGQAARRAAGFRHSTLPYGARLVGGTGPAIEVDPARAAHLARILALAATRSADAAAIALAAEGVPTRRGGPWFGPSVRELVQASSWLRDQPPPWPERHRAASTRPRLPAVRSDRQVRLLSGLLRCGICGGPVLYSGTRANGGRGVQCWRGPGLPSRCLPGAARKAAAEHYEAAVLDWALHLPEAWQVQRAAIRLAARDDPALGALDAIRVQRQRVKAQHDAGLIGDEEMVAESALLAERERAIAPRPPDVFRLVTALGVLREGLAVMEPEAANSLLRVVLDCVRVTGRSVEIVAAPDVAELLREAGQVTAVA
jgi:DNA invertase Pin-like site-specific DNA recombinase